MSKDNKHSSSDSGKHLEKPESKLEKRAEKALQQSVSKEGYEDLGATVKQQRAEQKTLRNQSLGDQLKAKGKAEIGVITNHFHQSVEITKGRKVVVPGRSKEEVADALKSMKDGAEQNLKIGAGGKHVSDEKSRVATSSGDAKHPNDAKHGSDNTPKSDVRSSDANKGKDHLEVKNSEKAEAGKQKNPANVVYGKSGNPAEVKYPDGSSRHFTKYDGKTLTEYTEDPGNGGRASVWRKNVDGTWDHLDTNGKPLSPESTKIKCNIEVGGDGRFSRTDHNVVSRFSDKAGFDYQIKRDVKSSQNTDGSKEAKNLDSGETWVLNPKPVEVRVPQKDGTEKCYDLFHGNAVTRGNNGKVLSRQTALEAQQELSGTPLGEKIMRFMEPNARVVISDGKTAAVEQKIGDAVVHVVTNPVAGGTFHKATGWVARADGQIATAAHEVVGKNPKIYFKNSKGEWQGADASITKMDVANDIAILELKDKSLVANMKRAMVDGSGVPKEGNIQALGIPAAKATLRPGDSAESYRDGGLFVSSFDLKIAKGQITGSISEGQLESNDNLAMLQKSSKKANEELVAARATEATFAAKEKSALGDWHKKESSSLKAIAEDKIAELSNQTIEQKTAAHQKAVVLKREADEAKQKYETAKKDYETKKAETATKDGVAKKAASAASNLPKATQHNNDARYEANYDNQEGMSGGPVYHNGEVIGMTRAMVANQRYESNALNPNVDIVVPISLINNLLNDKSGKYNYKGDEKASEAPKMSEQDFIDLLN